MDAVARDEIPVFDLASFGADYARLGAALGRAARDTGFFCVTHHGIDAALISQVFAQSSRFFSQNSTDKSALSIKHTGNNRGYVALGEERLDSAKPGDIKEAFNITTVRLKVEQIQLVSGVFIVGLACIGLQGV